MPRPKGSKNIKKTKSKAEIKADMKKTIEDNAKIVCFRCTTMQPKKNFYMSFNNPMQPSGRVPYCTDCIKDMISDNKGNVILENVKDALQRIDRPFLYDIWKSSMEAGGNVFGTYMKNLALPQYREFAWKDSVFEPQITKLNYDNLTETSLPKSPIGKISDFVVTDEIMDKWGYGYSDKEYYYFEKKWKKLIDNYGEKTAMHSEGLTTYIRFRVKEELATAEGNVKEAKEWGAMASAAAKDGKINVAALSKSDISGGIELLPQLFEAVESKVGTISIMPKLKEQPYDDADLIIWCILNYYRRLEGKSRIEYRDIWNFYDNMLHEHFLQQGYTEEQIQKEKEKRNNIFRDLGEVYREPIYEEGDD